jgi:hypothetical protein
MLSLKKGKIKKCPKEKQKQPKKANNNKGKKKLSCMIKPIPFLETNSLIKLLNGQYLVIQYAWMQIKLKKENLDMIKRLCMYLKENGKSLVLP